MKEYLYLIPFEDKKHFKIGISSNNFNRVRKHFKTYNAKESDCLIVTCKKGFYSTLERELLETFQTPEIKCFSGLDGYTEIRSMGCFEDVLSIIKSKHKNLNVRVNKFLDIIPREMVVDDKVRKKKVYPGLDKETLINSYNTFVKTINDIDSFVLKETTIDTGYYTITVKEEYFNKLNTLKNLAVNIDIEDRGVFLSGRYGIRHIDKHDGYRIMYFDFNLRDDWGWIKEKYPIIVEVFNKAASKILRNEIVLEQ